MEIFYNINDNYLRIKIISTISHNIKKIKFEFVLTKTYNVNRKTLLTTKNSVNIIHT